MNIADLLQPPPSGKDSDGVSDAAKEIEKLVPGLEALNEEIKQIVADLKAGKAPTGSAQFGAFNPAAQKGLNQLYRAQKGHQDAVTKLNTTMNNGLINLSGNIVGLTAMFTGGLFFNNIFKGAIRDEAEFLVGIREIAYTTQGISGSTAGLQESWRDVGKTVAITGKNVTVFQKQYLNNLRKGTRSQAETLSVTKTGLHTSHMLGSSAENTANLFHDWHMKLGRSKGEMNEISRGMQDVARWSGITGDELINIAKNSQSIMESMRNSGNFSAAAAKNIMAMSAAAEKLGVSGKAGELMKGLGSLHSFIHETSPGMKALLLNGADLGAQMGGQFDAAQLKFHIMNGTLMENQEALGQVARGSKEWILKQAQGMKINLKELTEESIQALPPEQRNQLDYITKRMGLGGIVEATKALESMEEASLKFSQKLDKLNKSKNDAMVSTEELRSMEEQIQKMKLSEQLNLTQAVVKGHKEGEKWSDTIANSLKDADPSNLNALNLSGLSGADRIREILSESIKSTNKMITDSGAKTPLIDESKIEGALSNSRQYLDLQNAIEEGQQAAMTQEKANADPISQIQLATAGANEAIRSYTGKALVLFLAIFGAVGIIGLQLGTVIGLMMAQMALNNITGKGLSSLPGLLKQAVGPKTINRARTYARLGMEAPGKAVAGLGAGLGNAAKSPLALKVPGLARGLAGLGRIAGVASKALGPIALVAGMVGGGLVGAFQTAANATEIFGGKVEDLSYNQTSAAQGAGFLTGVLNFLTFGIFSKYFGPSGTVTAWLAKFFAMLGPFRYVLFPILGVIDALIFVLKVLWGILKVIYSFIKGVFIGVWEGITEAFKPLIEIWDELMKAVDEFTGGGGGGGYSLADFFSYLSKHAETLGKWIGFLLVTINPVVAVVRVMIYVFTLLKDNLTKIIDWVMGKVNYIKDKFDSTVETAGNVAKTTARVASYAIPGYGLMAGAAKYMMGTNGEKSTLPKEEKEYYDDATKKGSIYVHDIYVESLLKSLLGQTGSASLLDTSYSSLGLGPIPSLLDTTLFDGQLSTLMNMIAPPTAQPGPLKDAGEGLARKHASGGKKSVADDPMYEKLSACEVHLAIIARAYINPRAGDGGGLVSGDTAAKTKASQSKLNSKWPRISPLEGSMSSVPILDSSPVSS